MFGLLDHRAKHEYQSGDAEATMTYLQATVVQLDNYGPWTVTPSPRPEPDLQALQSRIHADLSERFGHHEGYVFATRYDNLLAVTNGCSMSEHARIQRTIGNTYPVTVSMAVASASVPKCAVTRATGRLQRTGSAQDADRREVLVGQTTPEGESSSVVIAHFDVDDVTGEYTDQTGAYETFLEIRGAIESLKRHLYAAHGALTFFVGGDNAVAVCPRLPLQAYERAIAHVRDEVSVELKVGVGEGMTAQEAGLAAKHALEECRHRRSAVEHQVSSAGDD